MTTRRTITERERAIVDEAVSRAHDKTGPPTAEALAGMHGGERQIAESAAWGTAAKSARLVSPFWSAD